MEVCETFVVFGMVVTLGAGVSGFHPATKNLVHNGGETVTAPGRTSRLSLEEAKGAVSKEFCPEKSTSFLRLTKALFTLAEILNHGRRGSQMAG